MTPKTAIMCAIFAVAISVGQILFKLAGDYSRSLSGPLIERILHNYILWGAFLWYGATSVLWVVILSQTPLNTAYLFSLAGAALVPLWAWLFFKEALTLNIFLGYVLVLLGLFIGVRVK
jgi:drug/metabolite transporter (DMT)-like permease